MDGRLEVLVYRDSKYEWLEVLAYRDLGCERLEVLVYRDSKCEWMGGWKYECMGSKYI